MDLQKSDGKDIKNEKIIFSFLRRLSRGKVDSTLIQLFRYGMVAVIAFSVDFGALFAITHYVGIHYLVSAAMAFTLGVTTNYLLSVRWVFSARSVKDWRKEATISVLIGILGLGMNEAIIWFCTEILLFHYLISKIISTGVVFFFNFFTRKILLFNKPNTT